MAYTVPQLVEKFGLLPHPEGGFYKETYRSGGVISHEALPPGFGGDRCYATAIYFLLTKGSFSAFHRIQSDECWHFYTGDPLNLHILHPGGAYEKVVLSGDIENGSFQFVVPAGCWFASETTGNFSFVGCTVAPGFDFADFELAGSKKLARLYPEHEAIITKLTRS